MRVSLLLGLALAVAPAQAGSMQQAFDMASQAAAAGECAKAVPLFEALERNPAVRPGSIPAAAIGLRKGQCLIALLREAEGEAAILAGLPRIERAGEPFTAEAAEAYLALGRLSLARGDYHQARNRFEEALRRQTGTFRLMPLSLLAKASAYDPGPQPLAYADEALTIAEGLEPRSKDTLAAAHTLRARILLNRGRTQEAYDEFKEALVLSGGLTSRTTLAEASLRGDLATAAMLLDKKDEARRYLAMTGAGRIAESPFATAVAMDAPECGEESGLDPDDFAIVEFAIAEDGSVPTAYAVYTRGGPAVAAAFARAARNWFWHPEDVAKIPLFYRVTTRVELRCSAAGGPVPGTMTPLYRRFARWATARLGLSDGSAEALKPRVDQLRAALSERERAGDPAGQVAAAGVIAMVDPRTSAETVAMLDEAIAAAPGAGVPTEHVNALRIMRLYASPRTQRSRLRSTVPDFDDIAQLARDPAIAGDALALNTLRLSAGTPFKASKLSAETDAWLRQVVDDQRLPEHHPLRQVALLKLANRAATAGQLDTAQAMFARTGLSEQQCALLGVRPAMRRSGSSSAIFPATAMQYGFEGWVQLEFDITADGRAADPRALIAYPPFVFVDAATDMTRYMRYEAAYRPSGGVACSANGTTIVFRY